MKKLLFVTMVALILGFSTLANAALQDNGGGLIYDKDLNITWYDYTYKGPTGQGSDWHQATDWVNGLTVGGITGWRSPRTLPVSPSGYDYNFSYDGSTDMGYNITSPNSELANLFYVELRNRGWYAPDGSHLQENVSCLVNQGPFKNLQPYFYWSGTEVPLDTKLAWGFYFYDGTQDRANKDYSLYSAIAVHEGNVVPLPGALWLLAPGLIGLIGLKKKYLEQQNHH